MGKQVKYDKLEIDGLEYNTHFTTKFNNRKKWAAPDPGAVSTFIPGTIVSMNVKEGDSVREGDLLCILEAMKMRNKVLAPVSGTITAIHVATGSKLPKNALMFEIR